MQHDFVKSVFAIYSILIDRNPQRWCDKIMRVDDKVFVAEPNGVTILPKQGGYSRFISDSWYDDVDTDNL